MSSKARSIDMCSGNLFRNIFLFSMPLMLSSIMQLLYNAADIIVVGRYAGQDALAGVGTSTSLIHLTVNLFVGLSGGVSVAMGRAVGAKDDEKIHRVVHTAISISLIAGLFLTIIGTVFSKKLLLLMDVPENVLPQAQIYTQIMFFGMMPSMVYNFGSGLLRSMGDTKRPLYIITVSGIINVVLNLFFVIQFKMKADGVALATIISQAFSAVMIVILLMKQKDSSRLMFSKLCIYKKQLSMILKIGIPAGVQSMIFSFSNVIVQSSVNSFGGAAIAGCAAASNIDGFMYAILNTFFHASMTFISQNIGAKKYARISKIVRYCLLYVLIFGIGVALITVFLGRPLLRIYSPEDTEAVSYGYIRLLIVGITYMFCGYMEVMSGALRGMGESLLSMVASITGICGIRIVWIFTVFKAFRSLEMLFLSYPVSWIGTFAFLYVMYRISVKKFKKADA